MWKAYTATIREEEVVNELPGVAGKVNLIQSLLTVSDETDVPGETIRARIERAGYHVAVSYTHLTLPTTATV